MPQSQKEKLVGIILLELLHPDTLGDLNNPLVDRKDLMKTLAGLIATAILKEFVEKLSVELDEEKISQAIMDNSDCKKKWYADKLAHAIATAKIIR